MPQKLFVRIAPALTLSLVAAGCAHGPFADRAGEGGAAGPHPAAGTAADGAAAMTDSQRGEPAGAANPAAQPAAAVQDRFVPELVREYEPGRWDELRAGFRLAEVDHPRVDAQVERYAGRQAYFEAVARRAEPYLGYLVERIRARDLPGELLLVPIVESAFRPFAYSHARAGGLWQFKPGTARTFGVRMNWWYDGRRDIVDGTEAALDYLSYLHDFFDGNWILAIAAYNAGEGTVRNAIRANERRGEPTDFWHLDLPEQTERYIPRLLALKRILQRPQAHGITLPEPDPERALTIVELEGQIDLARAAEWAGVSIETLYRYNPGLNRWATAPDGPHRLAVPSAAAPRLREAMAQHGPQRLVQWHRHRVNAGDTLNAIAEAYDTTVDAIRKANGLDTSTIRVGEHLVVPTASRTQSAYVLSAPNRRRAQQADGPSGRERVDYRVKPGDTLWAVAQEYDVDVRRLADWNGMAPSDPLQPGDRLVVWLQRSAAARGGGPDERVQEVDYTVERGDSLAAIAQRFNLDVRQIQRWNDLQDTVLQPGQTLQLRVDVTTQAGSS